MIIKKWDTTANGGTGGWVAQSAKVTYTDIVADVAAETPVSIFSSGKLKEEYLPVSVFGGMKFVGTFSKINNPSPLSLAYFIEGTAPTDYTVSQVINTLSVANYNVTYANMTQDVGQRFIGHYWVATSTVSLFDGTTSAIPEGDWASAAFDDGVVPTSVGGQYAENITLEAGDWLIITGYVQSTKTFKFSIINNTYGVAASNAYGVVKLGYTTANKNYAVQTTVDGLYVNVPWENTTYTAASGIYLNESNEFEVQAGVGLTQESNGLKMTMPHTSGTSTPAAAYQVANNIWFDLN